MAILFIGYSKDPKNYLIQNSQLLNNQIAIFVGGNGAPQIQSNVFEGYDLAIGAVASTATSATSVDSDAPNFDINTNGISLSPIIGPAHASLLTISTAMIDEYLSLGVSLNPLPIVTLNQFRTDAQNYFTGPFVNSANVRLNARNNWWGSTSVQYISDRIKDYSDNGNLLPVVDYAGFLSAPEGSSVPGFYLNGPFLENLTLEGGRTYTALGNINVPRNISVGMEANTQVAFPVDFGFTIEGNFQAQGSKFEPIRFYSSKPGAEYAEWSGINIALLSRDNVFDFVSIENAVIGLQIIGVSDGEVDYQGDPLLESWSQISNSRFHSNSVGLSIVGGAAPQIMNSVFSGNITGVDLHGLYVQKLSPKPVINYSDFSENLQASIKLNNYGLDEADLILDPELQAAYRDLSQQSNSHVSNRSDRPVDARYNYWGSAQQGGVGVEAAHVMYIDSGLAAIDLSSPLEDTANAATVLEVNASNPYFSPNNDGVKDTSLLIAELSGSSPWHMEVIDNSGQVLREASGNSRQAQINWNGQKSSGGRASEAKYGVRVLTEKGNSSHESTVYNLVELDVTLPTATITSPENNHHTSLSGYAFEGIAYDKNFDRYYLDRDSLSPSGLETLNIGGGHQSETNTTIGFWAAEADPEGRYRFTLRAKDLAGNERIAVVDVTADRTPPTASLSTPSQDQVISEGFDIFGTAQDQNLALYKIEYRSDGPSIYQTADSATSPVASGKLGTWQTLGSGANPAVPSGNYFVRLAVSDKAGHSKVTQDIPVQVSHDLLTTPTTSRSNFDPLNNEVSVSTRLKKPITQGADIVLKIYDAELLVRTVVIENQSSTSNVSLSWDGRDDQGKLLPAGNYNLSVEVRIGELSVRRYDLAAPVHLDYGIGAGSPQLSAHSIDYGVSNQQISISYGLLKGANVELRIVPEAQYFENITNIESIQSVRTMTSNHNSGGNYSFVWSGLDNAGLRVPNGIYRVVMLVYKNATLVERHASRDFGARQSSPSYSSKSTNSSADWNEPLWYRMNASVQNMKARLSLALTQDGTNYTIKTPFKFARAGEQTVLSWEGVNPENGKPFYGYAAATTEYYSYAPNEVFVGGSSSVVRAPDGFISAVSDPYRIYLSYGHVTHFGYHLDKTASVTIKVLPIGVVDPNSDEAITVIENEVRSPGLNSERWTAINKDDSTGVLRDLYQEGAQSFVIIARATDTGDIQQIRGMINVRR